MLSGIGELPKRGLKKHCDVCSAWMPLQAVKCTKCESFQGWRKYSSISTATLAVLTALVSVTATLIPAISSIWEANRTDIVVSYGGDDDQGGLFLLVANGGSRPGAIASVDFFFEMDRKPHSYQADISPESNPSVLPNSGGRIRYMIDVGNDMAGHHIRDVASCYVMVKTFGFQLVSDKPVKLNLDCGKFRPLGLEP